jgi:hypothetical protein
MALRYWTNPKKPSGFLTKKTGVLSGDMQVQEGHPSLSSPSMIGCNPSLSSRRIGYCFLLTVSLFSV